MRWFFYGIIFGFINIPIVKIKKGKGNHYLWNEYIWFFIAIWTGFFSTIFLLIEGLIDRGKETNDVNELLESWFT